MLHDKLYRLEIYVHGRDIRSRFSNADREMLGRSTVHVIYSMPNSEDWKYTFTEETYDRDYSILTDRDEGETMMLDR